MSATTAAALRLQLRGFCRHYASGQGGMIGLLLVGLLLLAAALAPVLAPHDPLVQARDALLRPPGWPYPLGTDDVGRDVLARLLYGARLSLAVGVIVVTLGSLAGTLLGVLAGFSDGLVDGIVMRLMDVLLALPTLLLAVAIVAVLGPGLQHAMLAVAVVQLPAFVRLTRASVRAERRREYVAAARMVGSGRARLMFRTVLPNCMAPLIVQASLCFSTAILDTAALGFLGLGAQPPTPEWGTMLADALQFVQSAWWVVTFPGAAILLTVLGFNLIGDGLRDALDPRLKR
ncbi:MAG: ABC transporter permease subunit [Acidisphaera sp.]|nr:ABC transporter permease subunit [Acidisphaera sp.]